MERLISFLDKEEVEFERQKKLSLCTSVGVGGTANLFVLPKSKEKFTKTLRFLTKNEIPYFVTGNMTNLLPSDSAIDKVILSTLGLKNFSIYDNRIEAEAGVLFSKLILSAKESSLGGFERLFGIPGTVGGMLRINAGAYGCCISDLLLKAELYDPIRDEVFFVNKDDISFFYRDSEIKKRSLIVLSATFTLLMKDILDIHSDINEVKKKRLATQPLSKKTLGSVFKRTDIAPASLLIDKCGLKGCTVGGISVSDKHAGFFVNDGSGNASDFFKLCEIVKAKVGEAYGVVLEEEFEYLS